MAARNTPDPATPSPRRSTAWRALGWFWAVVLLIVGLGGATLQYLGPPPHAVQVAATAPSAPPPAKPATPPEPARNLSKSGTFLQPKPPNSPISAPDPALLEPVPGQADAKLPRIGPDGRMPMQVYAAGYNPADPRPRVAVLLANTGMSGQDSEDAITTLPAAISLAVSPYAQNLDHLLAQARAAGHELLIGIPMEPQGYSMNDPGPSALMTGLAPAENAARLQHVLALFTGYVGATGAMGNGLHGERYAASAQIVPMLSELASRGLLYVDPRPGGTLPAIGPGPALASRAVDIVLDEPPVRTEVEAKLAQLEQLARNRGSALGLAGAPSPVTTERLAAWAATLGRRGIALVPVSALISLPKPTATTSPPPQAVP